MSIRYLKDRASEESASIEVDPVRITRDSSNENPYLNYSANRSAGELHIMRQYSFQKKILNESIIVKVKIGSAKSSHP